MMSLATMSKLRTRSRVVLAIVGLVVLLAWFGDHNDQFRAISGQEFEIRQSELAFEATIMVMEQHGEGSGRRNRISRPWTAEQIYLEQQMKALGALSLQMVGEGGDKSAVCDDECTIAPYEINPECLDICRAPGSEARAYCWFCQHWAMKVSSGVVDSNNNNDDHVHYSKYLLRLHVVSHVLNLASMVILGNVKGLIDMYYGPSRVDQGKVMTERMEHEIEVMYRHGLPMMMMTTSKNATKTTTSTWTSGGGGGFGIQMICNNTLRLSIGGGGGEGMTFDGSETTFGGGRGAGFQIFSAKGKKVGSFGGGGGGGGKIINKDDDAITSSVTKESFGTKPDTNNSYINHEALMSLQKDLKQCWESGNLQITGGGGIGGGIDKSGKLVSNAHLSFSFAAFSHPCPIHCTPSPTSSTSVVPETQANPHKQEHESCQYSNMQEFTKTCVNRCENQTYSDCMCPCFRSAFFHQLNCSWAKSITCP